MKLEPKHIAPYLTYGLDWDLSETEYGKKEKHRLEWCKLIGINTSDTHGDISLRTNIETQNSGFLYLNLDVGKPILRDLSDLTKEITHNGDEFVPDELLFNLGLNDMNPGWEGLIKDEVYMNTLQWGIIQKLFEWHFNVFNLPEELYIKK